MLSPILGIISSTCAIFNELKNGCAASQRGVIHVGFMRGKVSQNVNAREIRLKIAGSRDSNSYPLNECAYFMFLAHENLLCAFKEGDKTKIATVVI